MKVELLDEKEVDGRVVWQVEFDQEALVHFAKVGFQKVLEELTAQIDDDGEWDVQTLEWEEDVPRQEEPAKASETGGQGRDTDPDEDEAQGC